MKIEIPGYVHGMWQCAFLTVATVVLIAGCTLGPPHTGNEPPATLYVFNVDRPEIKIAIYQGKWHGPFGGHSTDYIATVNGQRFVRLSVHEEVVGQATLFAGQPGEPVEHLSSVLIRPFVSGETYYAKVRTRGASEQFGSAILGSAIFMRPMASWSIDFDLISSDEGQLLLRQLKPQD